MVLGRTRSRIDGAPESLQGPGSDETYHTSTRRPDMCENCLRKPLRAFPVIFSLAQVDPPPKPGSRSTSPFQYPASQRHLQRSVYEQTFLQILSLITEARVRLVKWLPGELKSPSFKVTSVTINSQNLEDA